MKFSEYFSSLELDQILDSLVRFDKNLKRLHVNGYYMVEDFSNIKIDNPESLTFAYNNKVGKINQDIYYNCDKHDILELCIVGLCAYNDILYYNTSNEFIYYVMNNIDTFLNNIDIPDILKEYYQEVFINNNIIYLNDFLYKKRKDNSGRSNARKYVKTTNAGVFLTEQEKAYIYIFYIPVLVSIIVLAIIFFILKIN